MKHEPTIEQAAAATPSAPTLLERYIAYSRDFLTFEACRVAAELEIAEHLSNGPLSLENLAGRANAHAPSLFGLLG